VAAIAAHRAAPAMRVVGERAKEVR
jgi:hypothetical protein